MSYSILKYLLPLSACLLFTACDSGGGSSSDDIGDSPIAGGGGSVADLLSDEGLDLQSDDPGASKREFLITGDSLSSASFWTCTFTESGLYIDRNAVRFNLDGSGAIGNTDIRWQDQAGILNIESDTESFSLVNIEFGVRIFNADMFTADITNGQMISCDWTGLPRIGELLADPAEDSIPTDEDLFLDARLSTGIDLRDQDTYWQCEFDNAALPATLYYFFGNGRFLSDEQGRWGPTDGREIYITPDDGELELWSDVRFDFSDDAGYNTFSAISSKKGRLSCTIGGKPRAEIYMP